MLKDYSISQILELPFRYIAYYIGTFEDTEDPDIEWPHRHSFYSLVWFTAGEGFYVVDFEEYAIQPNRIFLVNPRQVHNWEYSENSRGYVLMIDAALALELGIDSVTPYLDMDNDSFIRHIFSNLIEESFRNDELADKNIQAGITYLYGVLERLSGENHTNSEPQNLIITQLKKLIFESPGMSTVGEYADKLRITEENLNSSIKVTTGLTAKQYILDLKITEAKRLLIYSAENVAEIAFRLGFEDSSYFSRIFKKKTSFSPSDFLKKYRKDS